jgi:hypothetical protein
MRKYALTIKSSTLLRETDLDTPPPPPFLQLHNPTASFEYLHPVIHRNVWSNLKETNLIRKKSLDYLKTIRRTNPSDTLYTRGKTLHSLTGQ